MVPLVEDVETADEAINNFYYPPLGNGVGVENFGLEKSRLRIA
jgi:2-keto-3-deoxy-L-rhamnonate aldolase RhmA